MLEKQYICIEQSLKTFGFKMKKLSGPVVFVPLRPRVDEGVCYSPRPSLQQLSFVPLSV